MEPSKEGINSLAHIYFSAVTKEEAIYLHGKGGDEMFKILGSSLPVIRTKELVRECIIHTREKNEIEEDDIIIVKHGQGVAPLRLHIPPARDYTLTRHINLKTAPFPPRGILIDDDRITIHVGEEKFTSAEKPKPGYRQASGDAICKYAVGRITLEELRAATTEAEEEKSVKEQQIETLKNEVLTLRVRTGLDKKEISVLGAQIDKRDKELTKMTGLIKNLYFLLADFNDGAKQQLFKNKILKNSVSLYKKIDHNDIAHVLKEVLHQTTK